MSTTDPEATQSAGSLAQRVQARVGSVVDGKWRLDRLLGMGGMAAVYAATHRNGKRAAVKVLHPAAAADSGIRARFLREGYVANKLEHPGVVSIVDDDEAPDGTVYLVMELLEGEPLDAHAPEGTRLPVGDVLVLADQVLSVLVVAHAKGVLHRDLKPSNLFLKSDGTLKVLDFGIARLRESGASSPAMRTTISAMGTPGFMPPEQARGRWEQVSARSDVWAVGATMFTLLTGSLVHDEETQNEQLLAAMSKPCPPLLSMLPEVPEPVAQLVDKALAFDASERWEDAEAMQVALRAAYAELEPEAEALGTGKPRLSIPPRPVLPETFDQAAFGLAETVRHAARETTTQRPLAATQGEAAPSSARAGKVWGLGALALFGVGAALFALRRAPASSDAAIATPVNLPGTGALEEARPTLGAQPPSLAADAGGAPAVQGQPSTSGPGVAREPGPGGESGDVAAGQGRRPTPPASGVRAGAMAKGHSPGSGPVAAPAAPTAAAVPPVAPSGPPSLAADPLQLDKRK